MEYILAVWVISSVLTYGLLVGHFQGKYSLIAHEYRIKDRVFAFIASLAGPFGLLGWFVTCDHWEWRL